MLRVEEFQEENSEIMDLQDVLSSLIENQNLHENPIVCELLNRYADRLKGHLAHEDRSVYAELLGNSDKDLNKVAQRFIDNTHELNRILGQYTRRWCGSRVDMSNHAAFLSQSKELFHLVDERIHLEEKRLFPAFGRV